MNETTRVVISAQASLFCSRAVQTCSHIFMLSATQHTSQPPISSARNGRVISSRCSLPRSLFEGHAGPTALRVRQTCQEGRKRGNTPSRCPAPFLCGIIQRLIQLDRQRCFRAAPTLLARFYPALHPRASSSRPRWPLIRDPAATQEMPIRHCSTRPFHRSTLHRTSMQMPLT